MHKTLPISWKQRLAHLMQFRFLQVLMVWGIYLFIPRHRIGINVVVLDERKRVLLLKHVFHPQVPWGLPGGWLGRHEDPKEGALRELREETGLTAVLQQPLLLLTHDVNPQHIGIVFLAQVEPGPLTLSSEILEAGWFELDDVPKVMTPGAHRALDRATAVLNQSGSGIVEEFSWATAPHDE